MIAGEHRNHDVVKPGMLAALPAGEPDGEFFQPAEAAGRLGQNLLAARSGLAAVRIIVRQAATERTQIIEFAKLHAIPFSMMAENADRLSDEIMRNHERRKLIDF
jgi:hypothetical protein